MAQTARTPRRGHARSASRQVERIPGAGPTPLIGRDETIRRLEALVRDALEGRGSTVLLCGEPGIGKTRHAQEVTRTARAWRARTSLGVCDETAAAVSFWPWIQVLRAEASRLGREELAELVLDGAEPLVRLLPELREISGLASGPTEPAGEAERVELFQAVTSFLARVAARAPRILILDDVHAADTGSLHLLQFASRHLREAPICLLVTYRDVEVVDGCPAAGSIARLRQENPELLLEGLDEGSTGRLLSHALGRSAPASLRRAVHARTRGNPLFVKECARLLRSESGGEAVDQAVVDQTPLPEALRNPVQRRVESVSLRARRVLQIAAVMGREFEPELLLRVWAEECPSSPAGELDEVLASGIVERSPRHPNSLRFGHALLRDAIYEALPLREQTRLHRDVALAIESLHGEDSEERATELAHHFSRAEGAEAAERTIRHAARAAELSLARLAYEDAVRHLDLALDMLPRCTATHAGEGEPSADAHARRRGDLLLRLGAACWQAGEGARARAAHLEAATLARRVGAPELLAKAAIGFAGRSGVMGNSHPEEVPLLEEALAAIGSRSDGLRVRLLARLSRSLYLAGTDPSARGRRETLSREAVEQAETLGQPRALYDALNARHVALSAPAHAAERLEIAGRMLEIAHEIGSRRLAMAARLWRVGDLLELGDGVGVDREIQAYDSIAQRLGQSFFLWLENNLRAMRALLEGRFAEGERLASESLAHGQRIGNPDAGPYYVVHLFTVRRAQGRLGELEGAIRAAIRQYPAIPVYRMGLANLLSEVGRMDEAREAFEQAFALDLDDFPRDGLWAHVLNEAALVCHRLGDRERARRVYELMRPYDGYVVVLGPTIGCEGAVGRYLGLLAGMLGRFEEAERHFEAALALNTRLKARPFVAQTREEYASLLFQRDGPGDRERGQALLARALAGYEELGMVPHRARALARLQECGASARLGAAAAEQEAGSANWLCLEGHEWSVSFQGRPTRLRDTKGMRYLAALLAHPGRDLHVLDLAAAAYEAPTPRGVGRRAGRARLGRGSRMLDSRAREEYRRRLAAVDAELAAAEDRNDPGRAEALRTERAAIEQELAAAFGLRGRARRLGDPSDHARKAVYNRIRAALARIEAVDPALAHHLSHGVRTGTYCRYRPEREAHWEVRAGFLSGL